MDATTQPAGLKPGAVPNDLLWNLVGITATVAIAGGLPPDHVGLNLGMRVLLIALTTCAYVAHAAACRSHPPRVRSARGFFWAPFGRIRRIPEGMPLLAAKKYYYDPSVAYSPMRAWVGWWNCKTFPGDREAEEYFFIDRRSRYAIPASALDLR
jgi:hypothetical protein